MTPSLFSLLRAALKIGLETHAERWKRLFALSGRKSNSRLESNNGCDEARPRRMVRQQPLKEIRVARR